MNNLATNKLLVILQFNANGLKTILPNYKIYYISDVYISRSLLKCIVLNTINTNFHISGYILLKVNHPDDTAHSGVAIFIKSSILFQPLPNNGHDHIQSCMILIKLNNISITPGAFYSPPRHNITNIIFTDYFNIIKNNFSIGGDFNAKHHAWSCRANNSCVIVFHNFCNLNNI